MQFGIDGGPAYRRCLHSHTSLPAPVTLFHQALRLRLPRILVSYYAIAGDERTPDEP